MELDALGIWVLISVTAPGEIVTTSETWHGCDYARGIYLDAADTAYDPDDPYGPHRSLEVENLAECVFMPCEALTPPQDL